MLCAPFSTNPIGTWVRRPKLGRFKTPSASFVFVEEMLRGMKLRVAEKVAPPSFLIQSVPIFCLLKGCLSLRFVIHSEPE
jgi:hypothetical protein